MTIGSPLCSKEEQLRTLNLIRYQQKLLQPYPLFDLCSEAVFYFGNLLLAMASLVAQLVKNPPAMKETPV